MSNKRENVNLCNVSRSHRKTFQINFTQLHSVYCQPVFLFVFLFVFSIFSSFFFFFKKYGKVQMVERLFFFSSSQNILLFSFWIIYIRVRHSKGLSFVLSFFSMRLLKLDYFPKGLLGGHLCENKSSRN